MKFCNYFVYIETASEQYVYVLVIRIFAVDEGGTQIWKGEM